MTDPALDFPWHERPEGWDSTNHAPAREDCQHESWHAEGGPRYGSWRHVCDDCGASVAVDPPGRSEP